MSSVAHDRRCAQCLTPEPATSPSFKHCANCKQVLYCSRTCQKAHWQTHKQCCKSTTHPTGQEGTHSVSSEATTSPSGEANSTSRPCPNPRCNYHKAMQPGARSMVRLALFRCSDDEGTIYYLKTSREYIRDISVSGPYYPLEVIKPQVFSNMQDSKAGCLLFQKLVENGQLMQFEHLIGPLDHDNSRKIEVEVCRMKNASLARRLPCPVYNVVSAMPSPSAVSGDTPGVEDMNMEGGHVSLHAANRQAQDVLRDLREQFPQGQIRDMSGPDNQYVGYFVVRGRPPHIVRVSRDDGTLQPVSPKTQRILERLVFPQ